MDSIAEGRLAAHRAFAILSAAGENIANPYGGDALGLKAAMRNVARLENRSDEFVMGFEAESEAFRKDLAHFTGSLSWEKQG